MNTHERRDRGIKHTTSDICFKVSPLPHKWRNAPRHSGARSNQLQRLSLVAVNFDETII